MFTPSIYKDRLPLLPEVKTRRLRKDMGSLLSKIMYKFKKTKFFFLFLLLLETYMVRRQFGGGGGWFIEESDLVKSGSQVSIVPK